MMSRKTPHDTDQNQDTNIKEFIQRIPLPAYNADQLAAAMHKEMKRHDLFGWRMPIHLPRMAWAASFVTGILLCFAWYLLTSSSNTIQSVQFISRGEASIPSWLWHWKLSNGYPVNIPEETTSIITLADYSTIECRGGTALSVQYTDKRDVNMKAGWIEIHAEKNPAYPMQVKTPFGIVHVTGTVFQVEVVR